MFDWYKLLVKVRLYSSTPRTDIEALGCFNGLKGPTGSKMNPERPDVVSAETREKSTIVNLR